MSLGDPLGHICFRFRIGSQAADGYDVQGAVGMPIATSVKSMPDRLAGRCRDWTYAAQRGEAGLGSQTFRIIIRGEHNCAAPV